MDIQRHREWTEVLLDVNASAIMMSSGKHAMPPNTLARCELFKDHKDCKLLPMQVKVKATESSMLHWLRFMQHTNDPKLESMSSHCNLLPVPVLCGVLQVRITDFSSHTMVLFRTHDHILLAQHWHPNAL